MKSVNYGLCKYPTTNSFKYTLQAKASHPKQPKQIRARVDRHVLQTITFQQLYQSKTTASADYVDHLVILSVSFTSNDIDTAVLLSSKQRRKSAECRKLLQNERRSTEKADRESEVYEEEDTIEGWSNSILQRVRKH